MIITDEFTPLQVCLDVINGSLQRNVMLELETSPITASSEQESLALFASLLVPGHSNLLFILICATKKGHEGKD